MAPKANLWYNEGSMRTAAAIAHCDTPDLTLAKNVRVPPVVPVLLDFDHTRQIGVAQLTKIDPVPEAEMPGAIRADLSLDDDLEWLEDPLMVQAGFADCQRVFNEKDGIAYIVGGYVSNVSVISIDLEAFIVAESERQLAEEEV